MHELDPKLRERVLDALVLPDRPSEHGALPRVFRRALQGVTPEADSFACDEVALRIERN
jgi:hypothetical protein